MVNQYLILILLVALVDEVVEDDGTVHISYTYWSGDGSALPVSIGNAHASSTVTVKPPLLLGMHLQLRPGRAGGRSARTWSTESGT